ELVEGERSWSIVLETASLAGRLAAPPPPEDALVLYRWRRGTLECIVPIVPGPDGSFRCNEIPAGRGALVRCDRTRPLEEQTPGVLAEVDVEPGEAARVEL